MKGHIEGSLMSQSSNLQQLLEILLSILLGIQARLLNLHNRLLLDINTFQSLEQSSKYVPRTPSINSAGPSRFGQPPAQ